MSVFCASGFSEGDQILDGIGETALNARYIFDGSAADRTRNANDALIAGSGAKYVEDELFGKVLSLSGESFVELPKSVLSGAESLSVCGWIKPESAGAWQRFFDFNAEQGRYIYCTPFAASGFAGARITARGYGGESGPFVEAPKAGQWSFVAVVFDAAAKRLILHVNGKSASEQTAVTIADIAPEKLYLGKSAYDGDRTFAGLMSDVRVYRIALSDEQVAVIRHNAVSDDKITALDAVPEPAADEPQERESYYLAQGLTGVKDVPASTTRGVLPHLPVLVDGIYESGQGPKVRVIWPAPEDNKSASGGDYSITGAVPGTDIKCTAHIKVLREQKNTAPAPELEAFGLGSVSLLPDENGEPTQFMKNRDKFLSVLAQTNPDSFLFNFRDAFGEKQPEGVRPLGVWDARTVRLRGHASGHYLSAIAQAYAGTGGELQENFAEKMDYMVGVLYELSQRSGRPAVDGGKFNADPAAVPVAEGKAGYDSDLSAGGIRTDYWNWGAGFISAYPPDQFIMLEHGASYGGSNAQIWAPYYTLHKILAGLLDCYAANGDERALEIARDMGLWVHKRLSALPQETLTDMWGRYIAGEFGGMNESLARLYEITKDERFLACARLFDNTALFFGNASHEHGLAANVDTFRGKHANQHIPQIIGALEICRASGLPEYYDVAGNFWNICTESYMYCIGGVAGAKNPHNAECFTAQPDTLYENGFSPDGQNETCATYNMLKLSRALFMYKPDAIYMDYCERALYNHILASVAEHSPANTYHVPLNAGARKSFGNARMDGFTCCNGTAIESGTKLQDSIYFKSRSGDELYVNLYVPSKLSWHEKGITLTQSTSFPFAGSARFTFGGSADVTLALRYPGWAGKGYAVGVNGENVPLESGAGSYIKIKRKWKAGDTVDVRLPMDFHLSRVMDKPELAAVFYGPVLLAAQEAGPLPDWRSLSLPAENIAEAFAGDYETLRFTCDELNFKPFFETYSASSVYFMMEQVF